MNANEIKQRADFDRAHIWHPAAQMKDYESFPPVEVAKAKGCILYTQDNREIIDIVSSWWCNLLGHCNDEISSSVSKQLFELEHVIFANFTHPGAIELVEKLLKIVPKGIEHFNFADNGSSSVEMALKIAFQYQHQIGQTKRVRFACLDEDYHGETIGALSVGAMDLYSKIYKPMMMDNIHIPVPDMYRNTDVESTLQKARKLFEKHGHELCALIVEPILQGAAGMRIYPKEYLKGLYDLCREYGVLFIADEIATGFFRTGKMFACDHAEITPDIMCLSKAITGGYMPMSVVCTTHEVYKAFYADYSQMKAFVHSHTYAGNPLACAAANAVLDILNEGSVVSQASENAKWLSEEFERRFASHENIGQHRHIGLINAIEIVKDRDTKESFDSNLRLGYTIYQDAMKNGLLLRPIGDILYFNPPLNIDRDTLTKSLDIAQEVIFSNIEKIK
ncbi:adenosylmethionine--8-amino-7-oxononanoate transaminase [Succinivibrio faecicola]|uniref:Adenosylmethionine-8-amino-7-oxononanoate aminotransferase n=1 Tax=Succinivibrio faecicola TaxID=2820300 RepID=A0ABS7DG67_9GAMM|nr:adenosylmethionine--8-amino-7-oxononanoate transaminase [Succinivibrio faecicola]MBW7570059.1 adenosylmethionine--8-amino-7-oxononanoate transaminase [Succinivibrio faecicola]